MSWIKNTKKEKPKVDDKCTGKHKWSESVLIHIKMGLTFIGYWDYEENCWWSETMRIDDNKVLFWCKIPRLPKKNVQKEEI